MEPHKLHEVLLCLQYIFNSWVGIKLLHPCLSWLSFMQPFSCNHSLRKENWVGTQRDNWVFILNSSNPQEVVLYWFNARDALSFQVFLPNWTFLDKVLKATFLSHLNKERHSECLLYLYVSLEWHWKTQYQFEIVKSFLFVWISHALKEKVKYWPNCRFLSSFYIFCTFLFYSFGGLFVPANESLPYIWRLSKM